MTHHHLLPASARTTLQCFDRSATPCLRVAAGDTVTVSSLDASGYLEAQTSPGQRQPTMFPDRRGHCLTGPIAVQGARPGTTLAVSLLDVRPGPWGWTAAAMLDNRLNRRLGVAGGPPAWLLWDLDAVAGEGVDQHGHTLTLAPFLGVIGLPPNEPGEHSTIPPRAAGGGNIDCRLLVAGSTLYLPVTVPDALVCLGDGHAAQGDGEVGGTAIECPMTTEVRLEVVEPGPVPGIHADTPAGRVTFGFDRDLDVAMGDALDAMLTWVQHLFALDRREALALASVSVDLAVTQVANDVWGVHALLPRSAIGGGAEQTKR